MDSIQQKFYTAGYVIFVLVLIALGLWLLSFVQSMVVILIVSIFAAYLLIPAVRFLEKPIIFTIPREKEVFGKKIKLSKKERKIIVREKGMKRIAAIIVVYFLLFFVLFVVMSYIAPKISTETTNFMKNLPQMAETLQDKANEWIGWLEPKMPVQLRDEMPNTVNRLTSELEKYIYSGAQYTINFLQRAFSTLLAIFIIPIFTFYILLDFDKFRKSAFFIIPDEKKEEYEGLFKAVDFIIGRFIRGQLLVGLFIFVAVTIALLAFGIDYAFLIGLLSGVFNFVPYLGVAISLVPAFLIALFGEGIGMALIVTLVLFGISQLEGQVVSPAIMGEAVGLSPLIVIIAIVIGGEAMGLPGMLIAIPAAAAGRVVINYFVLLKKGKKPDEILEILTGK